MKQNFTFITLSPLNCSKNVFILNNDDIRLRDFTYKITVLPKINISGADSSKWYQFSASLDEDVIKLSV